MILQALTEYYQALRERGEITPPGWSRVKVSFALCIDADGAGFIAAGGNAGGEKSGAASQADDASGTGKARQRNLFQLFMGQFQLSSRHGREGKPPAGQRVF